MPEQYYFRRQVIEIFGFDEEFLVELETEDLIHAVELESIRERVYMPDQVERLRVICNLVNELEVNLPGVEVIMEMRENMIRMQEQFNVILESLVKQLKDRLAE